MSPTGWSPSRPRTPASPPSPTRPPGLQEALDDAGIWVRRDDTGAWESEIRRLLEPAEWRLAAKRARARAAELNPGEELAEWVDAIEQL